jgi:integrase
MTSIKVKFRPSADAEREGAIYYQIIHDRKVRQCSTPYRAFPKEWQTRFREETRRDVERLTRIVRRMESRGTVLSADDIVEEFKLYRSRYSLFRFMESVIMNLKECGKIRTAETYTATLQSFSRFRRGRDLMLDEITPDIIQAYEAYLRVRGAVPNTTSFYMRILRAVYNRAVESEAIEQRNPFRHVYTGTERTVKRAIPIAAISRIKNLELPRGSKMDFARDMFMLSFYLRGMSFVDMAFLRKKDRADNHVTYRRRKTGQRLDIAWTKEMQSIVEKYPPNPTQYLLPILTNPLSDERIAYRNRASCINRQLKTIARMTNLKIPLTLYCARHSWASAARTKGIPVSIISEGMGHDSEATTQIYLASLETSVIDRANALIIRSV